MTSLPLDTTVPAPALICLIGPAGSGKSTLASTWESTWVLSLDHYRALVSDRPGDQTATGDAAAVLQSVLEARLSRGLTSVIDATNCDQLIRTNLVETARRYGIPTAAVLMTTPLDLCLARNAARPAECRVPENIVRAQHRAATDAHPRLRREGFDHVVLASSLDRLGPLLERAANERRSEFGWDGGDGLGTELLLRRFFGPDIARLATWQDGSALAGGDRVVELRAGSDSLTLALRLDVDDEGDVGFDVLVVCPARQGDTEGGEPCPGPAWVSVYSVLDLHRAHRGDLDTDEDLRCAHCGYHGAEFDHEAADHAAGAETDEDQADAYNTAPAA
ncbi:MULTISPECIES: AAA family ATPase [unclassified Streptomyces]|uniref:AAA family ATPase n=1 Tax=unclassified Streptomyces TaxID=2593676 RepID=UPI0035E127DC